MFSTKHSPNDGNILNDHVKWYDEERRHQTEHVSGQPYAVYGKGFDDTEDEHVHVDCSDESAEKID